MGFVVKGNGEEGGSLKHLTSNGVLAALEHELMTFNENACKTPPKTAKV